MIQYHPIIVWLDIAVGKGYMETQFFRQLSIFGLE